MGYRFKRKETLDKGTRRIYVEQLEKAATGLDDPGDLDAAVHDARKRLKKARSLLRLVRADLGKKRFRKENRWLREAKEEVADARDAEALVETFDKLASTYPDRMTADVMAERGVLLARRGRDPNGESELRDRCARLASRLGQGQSRIDRWRDDGLGMKAAMKGLVRAHRRGARAFAAAYEGGAAEDFHDWRKRVKDHWYHCRLFKSVWRGPMQARIDELKRLSDLLGDEHDLEVLRQTLRRDRHRFGPGVDGLERLAGTRQQALRDLAYPLGRRIHGTGPECIAEQVKSGWQAWRQR